MRFPRHWVVRFQHGRRLPPELPIILSTVRIACNVPTDKTTLPLGNRHPSITVAVSPFAPRKLRPFAERKATLSDSPVLMNTCVRTIALGVCRRQYPDRGGLAKSAPDCATRIALRVAEPNFQRTFGVRGFITALVCRGAAFVGLRRLIAALALPLPRSAGCLGFLANRASRCQA